MNPHHRLLRPLIAVLGLLLLAAAPARAQYVASAPARPFPGYINEWLRADNPYMAAWDIGLNVRVRFEDKEAAGFNYDGSGADFRSRGTFGGVSLENSNSYVLDRIMPRVGYTDKWWSFLLEGRSSDAFNDNRGDNRVAADALKPGHSLTETDRDLNLYQGYLALGNQKEFPLSLKVGRQELSYGDQRLLGAFKWNNDGRTFDAIKVRYQNVLFGVDLFSGGVVYVAAIGRAGGTPYANAGNGYTINPGFSNKLGEELDLVIGWHVIPSTQIELGISHYFRGKYIKQSLSTLGSKDADFFYLQTTVSF